MKKYVYIIVLLILSCSDEGIYFFTYDGTYDVILVIGQSNTHAGVGLDNELDTPNEFIKQLGRFDENNFRVIEAVEPLDNYTKKNNRIGFALTFAKNYVNEFLSNDRQVLIIPCGKSGTGFINNRWNKGNDLYEDVVYRTNLILNGNSNSKLVAILWHQGESDVINPNYKENLDRFIHDIRNDLKNKSTPFILGGMVPYWVNQDQDRVSLQEIIRSTPNRVLNTKYANPTIPFTISKNNNEKDPIHYDAIGMRELGKRYYDKFKTLVGN